MLKRISWQAELSIYFILTSLILYCIHYLIFRDIHDLFFYGIMDIAFVFIQVLLVTFIINRLLSEREKKARLERLNMAIGAFFSEIGTRLLEISSFSDPDVGKIRQELIVKKEWSENNFLLLKKTLISYDYNIDMNTINLNELRSFLGGKRDLLLRIIENPNLMEHESFSDLLWAVSHLTEELSFRKSFGDLPQTDIDHLEIDIERAYKRLTLEWADYMKHLRFSYPYLFSLAMRVNPFDPDASVIVR